MIIVFIQPSSYFIRTNPNIRNSPQLVLEVHRVLLTQNIFAKTNDVKNSIDDYTEIFTHMWYCLQSVDVISFVLLKS